MKFLLWATLLIPFLFSTPAGADEMPALMFPAGCAYGENCWIVNYIDADPAEDAVADFACGSLTYDGHDGTDIGLRDKEAAAEGVNVLAAADGTVLRIRDAIPDGQPTPEEIEKILGQKMGCGNGVVIDHGGGWQTIYCHMKKDSITVKPQQKVRIGEAIGQIGQSGAAEFPHVHFAVFHQGKNIDPFTGREPATECHAVGNTPLWRPELNISYAPFSFFAAGFSSQAPDFEDLKKNAQAPEVFQADASRAIAFWFGLYGAAAGDKIYVEITAPDGSSFAARNIVQDKNRARQYYFIGKKSDEKTFSPGTYTGTATLTRTGADGAQPLTGRITKNLTLTP